MSTITSTVTIEDPIGLHARPAGQIVKLVKESGLTVRMGKAGEELVLANSPLRMMALKAKTGEELVVEVDTDDQAVAPLAQHHQLAVLDRDDVGRARAVVDQAHFAEKFAGAEPGHPLSDKRRPL